MNRKSQLLLVVFFALIVLCTNSYSVQGQTEGQNAASPVPTVTANKQWTPQYQTFDGVEMALVPPGCFKMGSTDAQVQNAINQAVAQGWKRVDAVDIFSPEKPQTRLCFTEAFWIDRTEVTQTQFKKFGGTQARAYYSRGDLKPIASLNWFEARDFCALRGARLPTEAEWEYAARGPDDLIYPWGNTFDSSKIVWNTQVTSNVGSQPLGASWVGALDLIGNVTEWTGSFFKPYPYDATDGREDANDPANTDMTTPRVIRGTAWLSKFTAIQRAAYRDGTSGPKSPIILSEGVRCARAS